MSSPPVLGPSADSACYSTIVERSEKGGEREKQVEITLKHTSKLTRCKIRHLHPSRHNLPYGTKPKKLRQPAQGSSKQETQAQKNEVYE
jgi:hypothetical protein